MGFWGPDGKGNLQCRYGLVGGISSFSSPAIVDISLDDSLQQLIVKNAASKKDDPVYLNYDQVFGFGEVNNLKFENDGTASAGNALLGSLVFGVSGAIIGGMSSMAKTRNIAKAFVIKYHPASNPTEEKALIFEIVQASNFGKSNHNKFVEHLQSVTNATCLTRTSQQL